MHSVKCISPVSVVSQCELMSGWRLVRRKSAPPCMGPMLLGKDFSFYFISVGTLVLWLSFTTRINALSQTGDISSDRFNHQPQRSALVAPLSSVAFAYADGVSMARYRFLPSGSGRSPRRAVGPSLPVVGGRTERQSTVTGDAQAAITGSSSSPQATPPATIKTCQSCDIGPTSLAVGRHLSFNGQTRSTSIKLDFTPRRGTAAATFSRLRIITVVTIVKNHYCPSPPPPYHHHRRHHKALIRRRLTKLSGALQHNKHTIE